MFDFDRVIERRGTHATKWDNIAKLSGITAPDAIPMWVADMDFAAPPGVTEALTAEVKRATHGYYADTGSWTEALVAWLSRRHGRPSWSAWHLAYSARHLQAARSTAERSAIVRGLWDGFRGRLGRNPAYGRDTGEYTTGPSAVTPEATPADRTP